MRNLQDSLHKGFINHQEKHFDTFKPKLLINKGSEVVLSTLVQELAHCKSFIFSVAFITESGLATLKSYLYDLKLKGVKGRILTSTYLSFNKPKVFKELLKLDNVEVRLTDLEGFHSKGYIFEQDTHYSLIVGSSNLTDKALKVNYEWNVKLSSHSNGDIVHHFKNQFEDVWQLSTPLTQEWIAKYETNYVAVQFRPTTKVAELPSSENAIEYALQIQPNNMQKVALGQLQAVRNAGKEKALVISATGTGKTYLSAFDVRQAAPKRMLFIVHREQILSKAQSDFRRILGGSDRDYGLLTGNEKNYSAKYLFATVQTLQKDLQLQQFAKDAFDYIIIDEVHKAGASSYLKIIDYFKPAFLMGMTATPERTDSFNVFELFDYNIAYEIRLQDALEEDMLCPFHYFGVVDYTCGDQIIEDASTLSMLVAEERIAHLIDKIEYYGYSGERVAGLIFCSRKEEVYQLSALLNERGYRTIGLTGEDDQQARNNAVLALEHGKIDYILTVDIFNEGIDIPCINQVVLLRQTKSSIIFVQQLGRGLRKHATKEYVTVIDFIGNYNNNYLIPVALAGDRTQSKESLRRKTVDTHYIKGVSTINFEEIARKQIFTAIESVNLNAFGLLKEAYQNVRYRLGKYPMLYDFIEQDSVDPLVLVEGSQNRSWYHFLQRMNEDIPMLSIYEQQVLVMLSQELLNGVRLHETLLIQELIAHGTVAKSTFIQKLNVMQLSFDDETIRSVERVLNLSFFTSTFQKKYGEEPIVSLSEHNEYIINEKLDSSRLKPFFKALVEDVIACSIFKSKKYSKEQALTLYEKYTRKDICRLLNWDTDEQATINGYKTKYQTCPIFVTYHKDEDINSEIKYGDELLSPQILKWYTRPSRKLSSPELQPIIHAQEQGVTIHIFAKKNKKDGKEFYYLGKGEPDQNSITQEMVVKDGGDKVSIVCMDILLENAVDSHLYHYLREE